MIGSHHSLETVIDGGARIVRQKLVTCYGETISGNLHPPAPYSVAQWVRLMGDLGIGVQCAEFPGVCRAGIIQHPHYGWFCAYNVAQETSGVADSLCCAFCHYLMAPWPTFGAGCVDAMPGITNEAVREMIARRVAAGLY